MDVDAASSKDAKAMEVARARKRRFTCLAACVAVILVVVVVIVILAFTAFKPKRPVTTVKSVRLKDLKVSVDILRLRVNLNVSLGVDLGVKNPNKVGFKFSNSSAVLLYKGDVVGEAPIPAGKISADKTTDMNITLTLLADRLLSSPRIFSDVTAGTLPFSATTRISGKVAILKVFKIHVVSYTTCDLKVFISNATVGDSHCKYKTKL